MTYLPHFITLAGVWVVMVISPGPDFAVTVQYATARSRRDGLLVALGITSALSIWIVGSMAGMGVLLTHVSWLVTIIRALGALYLLYLGVRTWLQAHRPSAQPVSITKMQHGLSAWRVGFLTNISNPKAVAFFSSLFVVLLPANPPLWVQATSVVLMLGIAVCWFCIVACLFSLKPIRHAYSRAKRWIDYLTGGVFIVLGIRLAVER